jgi:hypothetical protein
MTVLLLVGFALIGVMAAFRDSGKIKKALSQKVPYVKLVPKAIGTIVITVQFSELVKTVEHISVVSVSAGLLLLAVLLATKAGTEGEELF